MVDVHPHRITAEGLTKGKRLSFLQILVEILFSESTVFSPWRVSLPKAFRRTITTLATVFSSDEVFESV
jgi:hypothetical protein